MMNVYMPDGKNVFQVAEEMTENILIFTHKNKSLHPLKVGDIIVQTIDNPNLIQMWVIGLARGGRSDFKPHPKNYNVIRFKDASDDVLHNELILLETAKETAPRLRKWLKRGFAIYYHGTCQQFINTRNLRHAISDMMINDYN